jgi:hypothetical protein
MLGSSSVWSPSPHNANRPFKSPQPLNLFRQSPKLHSALAFFCLPTAIPDGNIPEDEFRIIAGVYNEAINRPFRILNTTNLLRALGRVGVVSTIFEGFYDWGVILGSAYDATTFN